MDPVEEAVPVMIVLSWATKESERDTTAEEERRTSRYQGPRHRF